MNNELHISIELLTVETSDEHQNTAGNRLPDDRSKNVVRAHYCNFSCRVCFERNNKMVQNYRRDDPPTSILSGDELESSGSAKQQRAMCLTEVVKTPGLTAREIEDRIGIKAHKRLPELRAEGLVSNSQVRRCNISGRQAMTWVPNDGGIK